VQEVLFVVIVPSVLGCEDDELLLDVANVRFLKEIEAGLNGVTASKQGHASNESYDCQGGN